MSDILIWMNVMNPILLFIMLITPHIEQPPQTDSDDYVHEAIPLLFEFITFIL